MMTGAFRGGLGEMKIPMLPLVPMKMEPGDVVEEYLPVQEVALAVIVDTEVAILVGSEVIVERTEIGAAIVVDTEVVSLVHSETEAAVIGTGAVTPIATETRAAAVSKAAAAMIEVATVVEALGVTVLEALIRVLVPVALPRNVRVSACKGAQLLLRSLRRLLPRKHHLQFHPNQRQIPLAVLKLSIQHPSWRNLI
jgi:hypothetical protein